MPAWPVIHPAAQPIRSAGFVSLLLVMLVIGEVTVASTITIQTNRIGITPTVLAYNSGHFYPGSNTRDWWHYSGVNGARVFITPSIIEPSDDISGRGDGVTDQASFLSRRTALRAHPLDTNYINWPNLTNNYGLSAQHGSNLLNVNEACSALRQLGIQILICLSASEGSFSITDSNDWAGRWELWQHYYAETFYLARQFDIQRYQMYNEPNLASLTADEFLERLQLISDAVQSAVSDVNLLYSKSLTPQLFAPVTAGSASSTYPGWGKMVVTNRHTDLLGQTDTNFWLIRKYDYHEYNSSPANFGANLASLNSSLSAEMSPEPRFPTSISEFNVHTAGTFDTLTETLDSPSKYARFGSIIVNLLKNSCDEFYVFKFSQTLNTTTVKKNGMHFVDNTNAPYNIGGITKAGEVWRLFNQAAAPGRDRLNITLGSGTVNLDVAATNDPIGKFYHLFSANSSTSLDLTLDVSALNLPAGQPALLAEVSESSWGGVRALATVTNNQITVTNHGSNTVWLFSIPAKPVEPLQTVIAIDDAMVQDGVNKSLNYGSAAACWVKNNSTNASERSATFIKFHLPLIYHRDIQLAALQVRASSLNGASNVAAHIYGISNTNWSQNSITWSNAPNLAQNVAPGSNYINNFILGAGSSAQMVGELVAGNTAANRLIDVTKYLRESPGHDVSFLLAREVRFFGDSQNGEGLQIISMEATLPNAPRLLLFRLKDTDGDGISDDSEANVFNTNPNLADTDGDGFSDGEEVLLYGTNPGSNVVMGPIISTQPASQTVTAGGTANFSISASGTPPLSFQWLFNATNLLPGATNPSITVANVQASQAGNYSTLVSNQAGWVISSNAQLTVLPFVPPPMPLYDGFNYSPGSPLAGQGGWVLNGGVSGNIEAGSLSFPGLIASLGNRLTWGGPSMSLRLPLATNITSTEVYFSFLLRVDSLGSAFTGVGTLAGFTTGTGTFFATKINIVTNGAGGFNLGASKSTGTTYGGWAPQTFSVGETILVVGRYTFVGGVGTDDLCDIWLNPAQETFGNAAPPAPTLGPVGNGGTDLTQIDRFFFRSGGASSSPEKLVADEVRVGLTWADVTPPLPPQLTIGRAANSLALSWPTNPAGFALQSAPQIGSPLAWTNFSPAAMVSGTNYVVMIDPTNSSTFFRLVK